jgi:hypothetical protein
LGDEEAGANMSQSELVVVVVVVVVVDLRPRLTVSLTVMMFMQSDVSFSTSDEETVLLLLLLLQKTGPENAVRMTPLHLKYPFPLAMEELREWTLQNGNALCGGIGLAAYDKVFS